jgi:hypothetical protein
MNKLVLAMAFLGAVAVVGCEDDPHDLDFTHKVKDAGSTMHGGAGMTGVADAGTDTGSSAAAGSGGDTAGAGGAGAAGGAGQ